jgi:hypothetical protein
VVLSERCSVGVLYLSSRDDVQLDLQQAEERSGSVLASDQSVDPNPISLFHVIVRNTGVGR